MRFGREYSVENSLRALDVLGKPVSIRGQVITPPFKAVLVIVNVAIVIPLVNKFTGGRDSLLRKVLALATFRKILVVDVIVSVIIRPVNAIVFVSAFVDTHVFSPYIWLMVQAIAQLSSRFLSMGRILIPPGPMKM
jgi:hypothetical protein